ncbi:MAG: rhomboid family intramembrane serine protease [Anaerolineae bacterium]
MFPIGDDDVRGAPPPIVTWVLIGLNVLVFLYEASLSRSGLEAFFNTYGAIPERIVNGEQWFSLITSMFLHGGWLHVISNMVFLAVFGDNVEAILGKLWYLLFYLAGGISASLAHVLLSPGSTVPSLGASGAVAAVLGSYVVMFPRSRVRALVTFGFYFTITRVNAVIFLGIWFVMQLFSGVASLGVNTAQSGGVAYWAHVGGFVFGLVLGFVLRGRAQERGLHRSRRR